MSEAIRALDEAERLIRLGLQHGGTSVAAQTRRPFRRSGASTPPTPGAREGRAFVSATGCGILLATL